MAWRRASGPQSNTPDADMVQNFSPKLTMVPPGTNWPTQPRRTLSEDPPRSVSLRKAVRSGTLLERTKTARSAFRSSLCPSCLAT